VASPEQSRITTGATGHGGTHPPKQSLGRGTRMYCLTFPMQADFSVELGRDDETLEFPWAAPDGGSRYYDLKRHPETIVEIEEAARVRELREFLISVNAPASAFESAKCDAWASTEIHPEEEVFERPWKFGSYVDLLFTEPGARFSFEEHESFVKRAVKLLQRAPDIPASAEFLLRRCFYHAEEDVREGFYVTFYLFGYGGDEAKAQQQWAIALKLAGNALAQLNIKTRALADDTQS
jgi:hypothetical protein